MKNLSKAVGVALTAMSINAAAVPDGGLFMRDALKALKKRGIETVDMKLDRCNIYYTTKDGGGKILVINMMKEAPGSICDKFGKFKDTAKSKSANKVTPR